jgi:hypothetical protein
VAPEVWSGFRVALSDNVLSAIAATEQPLSIRSPGGLWAMLLALAWFSLAYWRRDVTLWEAVLVILGGAAALTRLGNAWVDAAAMIVPLGRQLSRLPVRPAYRSLVMAVLPVAALGVAIVTVAQTRPPDLPSGARDTALASSTTGKVLADWRWAADLQSRSGGVRQVYGTGGLASEPPEFWIDYLRIAQGHERWSEALQRLDVNLVVLDAGDQQRPAAELVRASPDWRVTYDGPGVLVAERVTQ